MAQVVQNLPAMRETWVRSLGWQDPLEKGMTTHSSILAWRSPVDRGAWRPAVHGSQSRTRLSDCTQRSVAKEPTKCRDRLSAPTCRRGWDGCGTERQSTSEQRRPSTHTLWFSVP